MTQWNVHEEQTVPADFQAAVGGHPLVARALYRRGIRTSASAAAFLDPDAYQPASAEELPGVMKVVDRLVVAIQKGEPVCVWGDFDVDGQTSTTILVAALRELGARVSYHIPVRGPESHGIAIPVLEQEINRGARLVLTCDTGIGSHDAVRLAHSRGVEVLITDHHTLPELLPPAEAIVNPHLLPMGHPLENLPGVGVAFKLVEALYACMGHPERAAQHLDLVALGIVADVAGLRGDTRYLLQRGLVSLRGTRRLGLQVMMENAEINPARLTEAHIGFGLGPRLNALGRLSDANPAVELLTSSDPARVGFLASELEGLNKRRRMLTDQVFQGAQEMIARDPGLAERPALVLAHQAWPAGVIGIVASRLVERYQKPVILFASPPGELARGSARSVEGCDITAAIASQAHLLISYGGHPMAAGLALDPGNLVEFQRGLNRAVLEQIGPERAEAVLEVDARLDLGELNLEVVADLERLAPFGSLNPALVLTAENLSIETTTPVGRGGEHVQVIFQNGKGDRYPVIWWQGAGYDLPEGQVDLAYTPRTSDYRGQRSVSLELVDARPTHLLPIELRGSKQCLKVQDLRGKPNPDVLLMAFRQADTQVWREGVHRRLIQGASRWELQPAEHLVIWSTPPGLEELRTVLHKVKPREIILFGQEPGLASWEEFQREMMGIVKYTLQQMDGKMDLERAAGALGHRRETLWAGLDWLAARGKITIYSATGDAIELRDGGKIDAEAEQRTERRIKALLTETDAFRKYFGRAPSDVLFGSDLEKPRS